MQEPKWTEFGSLEVGEPAKLSPQVQASLGVAWALGTIPWTFAPHLCLLPSLLLSVFLSCITGDMLVNNLSLPGLKYVS